MTDRVDETMETVRRVRADDRAKARRSRPPGWLRIIRWAIGATALIIWVLWFALTYEAPVR